MATLLLRHDRTGVRVVADDATLAWLLEFTAPGFAPVVAGPDRDVPAGDGIAEVRLVVDLAQHAALVGEAQRTPAREVPCFALDSQVVTLPGHDLSAGPALVDAKYGVVYRVRADGVEVVAAPGPQAGRLPLLRVVRELVSEALRRDPDRLQVHASVVDVGGRAWVLAGRKGSGKTTLLVHRLLAGGAAYVANDRAVVRFRPDGLEVAGLPTVVSVRPGTTARFPALAVGVPAVPHPSHLAWEELVRARASHPPFPPTERLRLTPAQLCRQLRADAVASAPLAAVVVPEVTGDVERFAVRRLHGAEARAALDAAAYGGTAPRGGATPFERFAGAGAVLPPTALLDRLAAGAAVVACRLGPAAYEGADGGGGVEAATELWAALAACAR